jgi:hypothetical protein
LIEQHKYIKELDHLRFYRGSSMRGTFDPGDCLMMQKINLQEAHPGDIVIFKGLDHPESCIGDAPLEVHSIAGELHRMAETQPVIELVHRVIAFHKDGLVTQGDNNPCPDVALVIADNLLGRVTHMERGGKVHVVLNGWVGLYRSMVLRIWKFHLWKLIALIGSVPYNWLDSSRLVCRLWHPEIVKVQLASTDGRLIKFISHGHTVGRWWPASGHFECKKPYDLVLKYPDSGPDDSV